MISIVIEPTTFGGRGCQYRVTHTGKVLIESSRNPEFDACRNAFCQALQHRRLVDRVAKHFGASVGDSYLRVEFAQDTDGFWLEPHTHLGVKAFTILPYLSNDAQHEGLGTDIYNAGRTHVGRAPFASNTAMAFVPDPKTYQGFERRRIEGVRKSIIVNYVNSEWRARGQLAVTACLVVLDDWH